MTNTELNELKLFEKKRKRKLIIFPIIFLLIVPFIILAASRLTTLSEKLNVPLPHTMTVSRARDQRSREVFDQSYVKSITRKLNFLSKEKVYDSSNVFIDHENAYYISLQFEDEAGYDYHEGYYIAGNYISISKDGMSELYKIKDRDEAKELTNLLDDTIGRGRRNRNQN